MSERDILNPDSMWLEDIQDNPCPDYGFTRTRPDLLARAKAPGGSPITRETQNAGHTFRLSWLNRSYECAQRILQFAAKYEDEYFTLIDQDAGPNGRHYVGRFEGEIPTIQKGNLSYDLTDLTFVEYPGAPMLQYPDDWDRDGIYLSCRRPEGSRRAATSGVWTDGNYDVGDGGSLPILSNTGNAGDWVTMEYRGYGCKLFMLSGPTYSQAQVYLDNVLQATVDCGAAADVGPTVIWTRENIPLGLHRVKLVATAGTSTANYGLSFVRLQVMR